MFSDLDLSDAVANDASLIKVNLQGADISWTDLSGANLTGAATIGVTAIHTIYCTSTRCPHGLNWEATGHTTLECFLRGAVLYSRR
ncbi:MAG: pentapeptide repeat-containing protein [Proteobacteria bacterium]|nr:pentapeptide repeat-containing protein [Pseudomonadota bacterium]MBT5625031.1 pentapeptide repeat-containing protein [Pseudomonadota bacterium]